MMSVWICDLLSIRTVFVLFIGRTLLPSCTSGLQSPFCPLVLLRLHGENTFSSRFDTIDLNPLHGWLIYIPPLSPSAFVCLSRSHHVLYLYNYSITFFHQSSQSDQMKPDFGALCLFPTHIQGKFKWQGGSCSHHVANKLDWSEAGGSKEGKVLDYFLHFFWH